MVGACFRNLLVMLMATAMLGSCAISSKNWSPVKRYDVTSLQRDYSLFRQILEESHPSLYWYTPKDSMDYYFDWGYQQLTDSLTEPEFRAILSYVTAKIKCGHTSTRYSRRYLHYLDTARLPVFPINIKMLENDTVVLNNTLQVGDVKIPRGTLLTTINGAPIQQVVDSLMKHIPHDGYNENYLRQTISNRGAFGGWLRLVAGYSPSYELGYIDSTGTEQKTGFRLATPPKRDSLRTKRPTDPRAPRDKAPKGFALNQARNLQIDTLLSTGFMTVNTFNNRYRLRPFFRKAFRELKKADINHLVVDVRGNGGGNVAHSTFLTRKIAKEPFKLADSLYAVTRKSQFGNLVRYNYFTGLFMPFITRKRSDGYYHFGYFERKWFKPSRRNHFDGNVYILTGPNSFSAAAIFARTLKGQSNVTLVGEETGGAAYGNSAWFIPDVRLPETGIRFRLPKFRLVIDRNAIKDGRGVLPDIEVKTTHLSVIENRDPKIDAVRQLIIEKS